MINGPAFPADPPSDRRILPAPGPAPGGEATPPGVRPFGKEGFSFRDLIDIINPLQHIPVVATIYRKLTGDALDAVPRLAGGALFGGIIGAVSAVANLVVKEASGKDIGENALTFLQGGFSTDDPLNAPPHPAAPDRMLALAKPKPVFTAGWQAAMAMPYCDAECLDPETSFFSDAVSMAAAFPESGQAAARYAKATRLAADAAALRLDVHG